MSSGSFGADWAPSTSTSAPASWAMALICSTGLIVPSTFEMWATATIFGSFSSAAA
jgi:RES domain-containing protein